MYKKNIPKQENNGIKNHETPISLTNIYQELIHTKNYKVQTELYYKLGFGTQNIESHEEKYNKFMDFSWLIEALKHHIKKHPSLEEKNIIKKCILYLTHIEYQILPERRGYMYQGSSGEGIYINTLFRFLVRELKLDIDTIVSLTKDQAKSFVREYYINMIENGNNSIDFENLYNQENIVIPVKKIEKYEKSLEHYKYLHYFLQIDSDLKKKLKGYVDTRAFERILEDRIEDIAGISIQNFKDLNIQKIGKTSIEKKVKNINFIKVLYEKQINSIVTNINLVEKVYLLLPEKHITKIALEKISSESCEGFLLQKKEEVEKILNIQLPQIETSRLFKKRDTKNNIKIINIKQLASFLQQVSDMKPICDNIKASYNQSLEPIRKNFKGLYPIGVKIHFSQSLREKKINTFIEKYNFSTTPFQMIHANKSMLIPPSVTATELATVIHFLQKEKLIDEGNPDLQVCIAGRLPSCEASILGSVMIFSAEYVKDFSIDAFSTSHDECTGARIMAYDAGVLNTNFKYMPKKITGRTDMLARQSVKDIFLYQLIGSLISQSIHGGIFQKEGKIFIQEYKNILKNYENEFILHGNWIYDQDKEKDTRLGAKKHHKLLQRCNTILRTDITNGYGMIFDIKNLLSKYHQIIQEKQKNITY